MKSRCNQSLNQTFRTKKSSASLFTYLCQGHANRAKKSRDKWTWPIMDKALRANFEIHSHRLKSQRAEKVACVSISNYLKVLHSVKNGAHLAKKTFKYAIFYLLLKNAVNETLSLLFYSTFK